MKNNLSYLSGILLLSLSLTSSVRADNKYRAYNQKSNNDIILAKGDIPEQIKYISFIKSVMKKTVHHLSVIEKELISLQSALKAGHDVSAKQAYIRAHYSYEVIRTIVVSFSHADNIINPHASYFYHGERSPKFTGFHRVEYAMFTDKNLADALKATQDLLRNIRDLKQRVAMETLPVAKLIQAAGDSIEMILNAKLGGNENRYSRSDLADIAANIESARHITSSLAPFLSAETSTTLKSQFATADEVLTRYRHSGCSSAECYADFEQLTTADRQLLFARLTRLAELLTTLRSELKIDVYYKYRNTPLK